MTLGLTNAEARQAISVFRYAHFAQSCAQRVMISCRDLTVKTQKISHLTVYPNLCNMHPVNYLKKIPGTNCLRVLCEPGERLTVRFIWCYNPEPKVIVKWLQVK